MNAEQCVGRGAADRVVPEVNVVWRRPGQRQRYAAEDIAFLGLHMQTIEQSDGWR